MGYDKLSHIETAGDVELFKNRIYVYGKTICIHLSFIDKTLRDEFQMLISKQIQ